MASPFFTQLEELIKQSAANSTSTTAAEVLADEGTPSTSIAILDNGEISTHCISTISDNSDTLFQACSISKPIGGLMMMKLIELGHFSVEDKMVDLLPPDIFQLMIRDTRKEALLRTVTVKQLMSHTSGMSIHGLAGYPLDSSLPSLYQTIEGRDSANNQPITMGTLPGLEFTYSGGGMTVLQCIVENVMKRPFAELVKEYVFEPLGMTQSFYYLSDEQKEKNATGCYQQGYYPIKERWHVLPELAAAGLWTTPADLLKAARSVQDSLDGGKTAILKKETAELMLTKIKSMFGLTWQADSISFGHGGNNWPGWHCHLLGFADLQWNKDETDSIDRNTIPRRCGISIMTNSAMGDKVYRKLYSAIAHLKGWAIPSGMTLVDTFTLMPFPALENKNEDKTWEEWISDSWEKDWIIAKDEHGNPTAGIDKSVLVKLRPAAIPARKYSNGKKSIDFVMDGISILLRLGWDTDEKRIIEVCNSGLQKTSIVHLINSEGSK